MAEIDIIQINRELSKIYNKGGNADEMWAKWCELTEEYFRD